MRANTSERPEFVESQSEEEKEGEIQEIRLELKSEEVMSLTNKTDIEAVQELINQNVLMKGGLGIELSPAFHNEISSWISFTKSYLASQGEQSYLVNNDAKKIVFQGVDCALVGYRFTPKVRAIAREIVYLLIFQEIKTIRFIEKS